MMRISAFLFSVVLLTACIRPTQPVETETATETSNDNPGNGDEDVTEPEGDTGPGPLIIPEPLDIPDPSSTTAPSGSYDLDEMLQHIGDNVVLPVYERFVSDAENLDRAVSEYCSALETDEETTKQATAKKAMLVAMDTWQIAEMMKIGPAVSTGEGDGLRDEVYSWRDGVGPCAVDGNVMTYHQKGSFTIDSGVARDYGLDALEYLLFSPDLNSICDSDEAPSAWSALSNTEKTAARCGYAALVGNHTVADAKTLAAAWKGFIDTFVSGNFVQGGEQEELQGDDMLYHAIALYADKVMKELKLGFPFNFGGFGGEDSSCGNKKEMCAEDLESQFARISRENMQRNMVGFEMMYFGIGIDGTRGFGFSDLVAAKDSGLAQDIGSNAAATKTALNQITDSFRSLIASEDANGAVEAVYDALDKLTDNLRDDIPNSTGLLLPAEIGGEND